MIEIFHVNCSEGMLSYLKEKDALKKVAFENKRYKEYQKMNNQIHSLENNIKTSKNCIVKLDKSKKSKYTSFDLFEFVALMDYPEIVKRSYAKYCKRFDKTQTRFVRYNSVTKGKLM